LPKEKEWLICVSAIIEQFHMKYCILLFFGFFFLSSADAQTRRRSVHVHKAHSHKIKYMHLKKEDFQFDVSLDFLQQQLSFTNTINQDHFFNAATVGVSMDKHLLFTNETGWTNNKETISLLFDGSKSLTDNNSNDYYVGAKVERVLNADKNLSFSLYTYPKWSLNHCQIQFEEGVGAIYNFKHGFLAGYDISVVHHDLKYFLTSMSLAVVKIL
jgi:hypothetical protein